MWVQVVVCTLQTKAVSETFGKQQLQEQAQDLNAALVSWHFPEVLMAKRSQSRRV